MRIAYIGSRHPLSHYSGVERRLSRLAPALAQRGHQVIIFGSRLADRVKAATSIGGVEFVEVPAVAGKHLETLSRSVIALALSFRKRFDAIHFTHQGPGILIPAAKVAGIPCVVTAAGLDWQRAKWGRFAKAVIRSAERTAVHFADEIIVQSKAHQAYFSNTYRRVTIRIPNGMDAKRWPSEIDEIARLGLAPDEYVLFAARLVPEKACHELIEAWNALQSGKKLVVAGAGAYNDGYVNSLKRIANPHKVIFAGHVGGALLEQLFAHCYLFVLPSHLEGMSTALLDALAYGRAALVSDIPENLEVIEENGFSFRRGDVVNLRATLAGLLTDEARVHAMAAKVARAAAGKSSWEQVAAQHEAIYEGLARHRIVLERKSA